MNQTVKDRIHQRFYEFFSLLVLGISILLRIPFLSVDRLWPDEALYAWNARRIFEQPALIFSPEIMDFHPPLFSIILSLGHFFLSPLEACHAVVFLVNILGIIAVYRLGTLVHGRFLGCFMMTCLSFSPLYFEMASTILIDGVLAVFTVLCLELMTRNSRKELGAMDLALCLSVVCAIMLKWSGGLVIPVIGAYYFTRFKDWPFGDRCVKFSPVVLSSVFMIAVLLLINQKIHGSWIPKVFDVSHAYYREPVYFYVKNLIGNVFGLHMIPLFIAGLWLTITSPRREYWVHGVWVVFVLCVISFMASKDVRFLIPIIPSIFLISGVAAEKLIAVAEEKISVGFLRPLALIFLLIFIGVVEYPRLERSMVFKSRNYAGFREAGEILNRQLTQLPNTEVYATSPRMVRYFTGINFQQFGGRLQVPPWDFAQFKDQVGATSSDVFLVVDKWEWSQPQWTFPLEGENMTRLDALGFKLENAIVKEQFFGKNKFTKDEAVWILRRPARLEQTIQTQ